ncbi:efflux RND transporter periplasmic adaptor subunit [Actinoplanes sp. NPDC026623]|uniref:efflux RND transporter periplasmic adaptor subunit n=1 Tax=Actinoplanes sp. NPDC026623 TaxID=3155610 RepID=UPI003409D4D4
MNSDLDVAATAPPRRRRTARWVVAAVVVAAAAAGSVVVVARHLAGRAAPPETAAVTTARLERRDLSTTRKLSGSIGYGAVRPVAGHREATVTWLPQPGATIKRGRQLYRADDQPVVLFYGDMPLFRPIAGRNLVGRDVHIIAVNLRRLGYSIGRQPSAGEFVTTGPEPGTKKTEPTRVPVRGGDGVLTAGLIGAIRRWQADAGLTVTGAIAVGEVEVLAGAVRVDSVEVQPGSPANVPLMSVTSTRKVITVAAEPAEAGSIERGARVTVGLPEDRTVGARVVSVGRNLAATDDGPPKLTVTVTVDDPKTIARLDSADVDVNVAGRTVKDVLAAPVEALVALTEGGYAVQGPAGLVAVRTGMFADGWVEITGAGLAEGTAVVVSS